MTIKLRLGKSVKTGIGGKRSKVIKSLKRTLVKRKKRAIAKRSRTTKRGQEAQLFLLIRKLVVREYEFQYGDGWCEGKECDHIKGRNAPGFELGAMLDPQNLQMLTPEEHRLKTRIGHFDHRSVAMAARMVNLSKNIRGKLQDAWTLEELKRVLKGMIAP